MRNFKLVLEYDGTNFNGWQTQAPGFRTIQKHLEEKLECILKQKINLQASGRTDSKVHALGQVAHFRADTHLNVDLIYLALNSSLDRDVSVISVEEMPLSFHAQRDVLAKTYRYTILNRKSPSALWRDRAFYYPHTLNLALMRRAAKDIKGKHDFKSFHTAAERSLIKNTTRKVTHLTIAKEGDLIHITITGNGFLHKMVRIIVSVLIKVGEGSLPVNCVPLLLKGKDRRPLPKSAPGQGLYLVSVKY